MLLGPLVPFSSICSMFSLSLLVNLYFQYYQFIVQDTKNISIATSDTWVPGKGEEEYCAWVTYNILEVLRLWAVFLRSKMPSQRPSDFLFLCCNDASSQIMNIPKNSSGFRIGFVGPSLPEFNKRALTLRISIYLYTCLSSIYPHVCIDTHTFISFNILNTSKNTPTNANEL